MGYINEALTKLNDLKESSSEYKTQKEELIVELIKANKLKTNNIDVYGTDEYWLADAIENLQDLDHIYQEYVPVSLRDKFKNVTGYEEELDESKNELKDRAKKHKKTDKKGAKGWFVNPNAGNVEYNVNFFNNAMGGTDAGCSDGGCMGEGINKKQSKLFTSSEHKKYIYNGPVYLFNDLVINKFEASTSATSEKQALNNIRYKANLKLNYSASMKLTLKPECLKVEEKHDVPVEIKEIQQEPIEQDHVEDPSYNFDDPDREDEYVVESIEKHDELNSKLWDLETKELRPEVKETINNIANEYVDLLNENDIKIKLLDTLLGGSNASYNYTENSDLDLHLIADTSVVDCPKEILSKLYDAYKSIFNDKYNINIRKINVEVYVEPDKTQAESNGIYSLKDGWLNEPSQKEIPIISVEDEEKFESEFDRWEKKYMEILKKNNMDNIEIEDPVVEEQLVEAMTQEEYSDTYSQFKENAIRKYRGFAGLTDDEEITKENLDRNAFNAVCNRLNIFTENLEEIMFGE